MANHLKQFRARLLNRGMTLKQWSRNHGYSYHTTRAALSGVRNGRIAKAIVVHAKKAA